MFKDELNYPRIIFWWDLLPHHHSLWKKRKQSNVNQQNIYVRKHQE